jgi:hypothetical protein
MADAINEEFASYREMFQTEAEKLAFDKMITQFLQDRGVDYVRGYVAALKDMIKRTSQ